MYARGDGVTQSYEDASRLMKKSAEQGFQKAQLTIARMYRLGQGVPRDAGRSQYWLAKAGTGSAQKNLASRVTEARSKSEPEKTSPSPHTVRVQPNSATPPASVDGFAGIKFGESIDDTIKKLNTRCETQVPHDAFHPQLRDDVIVCLPGLRIFGEQTEVAIHFAGAARAVDLISFTLRSKAAQREALKVIRTKYGDAVDSENLDGPLIDYYAGHQINVTAVNDGLAINYNAKSLANLLSREIADRREKVRQRTRENQSDVNGSAF
jgi:hypothetical protein